MTELLHFLDVNFLPKKNPSKKSIIWKGWHLLWQKPLCKQLRLLHTRNKHHVLNDICVIYPSLISFLSGISFPLLLLSTCRGCQPPQSDHTTASAAPSAQPPHLIPPVCQQPEQKYPERWTQPHSCPGPRHRRRTDHPGVCAAARQLGPQQ